MFNNYSSESENESENEINTQLFYKPVPNNFHVAGQWIRQCDFFCKYLTIDLPENYCKKCNHCIKKYHCKKCKQMKDITAHFMSNGTYRGKTDYFCSTHDVFIDLGENIQTSDRNLVFYNQNRTKLSIK